MNTTSSTPQVTQQGLQQGRQQEAHHEAGEEYAGPVTVTCGAGEGAAVLDTTATLRGHFEPIDGRFHWWGRLAADDTFTPGATVTLTTPHGTATGRLSDPDPWGRLRVTGTGRPPF